MTRADGTTYVVSSRVTYFAIGWVPPANREQVVALLTTMFDEVRAGSPGDQATRLLPEPVRAPALRAASLIRDFESVIGEPSAPLVEQNVRTPQRADNIGVFAGGPYRCEAAADLGDQAARALAALLVALGAVDVLCANID
jgi:hypothetical protein